MHACVLVYVCQGRRVVLYTYVCVCMCVCVYVCMCLCVCVCVCWCVCDIRVGWVRVLGAGVFGGRHALLRISRGLCRALDAGTQGVCVCVSVSMCLCLCMCVCLFVCVYACVCARQSLPVPLPPAHAHPAVSASPYAPTDTGTQVVMCGMTYADNPKP